MQATGGSTLARVLPRRLLDRQRKPRRQLSGLSDRTPGLALASRPLPSWRATLPAAAIIRAFDQSAKAAGWTGAVELQKLPTGPMAWRRPQSQVISPWTFDLCSRVTPLLRAAQDAAFFCSRHRQLPAYARQGSKVKLSRQKARTCRTVHQQHGETNLRNKIAHERTNSPVGYMFDRDPATRYARPLLRFLFRELPTQLVVAHIAVYTFYFKIVEAAR